MYNKLLKTAYSTEDFRSQGHHLIDQLADHLEEKLHGNSEKTIAWHTPEDEHEFWVGFLKDGDENLLFDKVLQRTVHLHSPKYIGHQATPTAPLTALTAMIGALLNNGMAIYEMGMAPSAMERIVTDLLCKKIGYRKEARGFLTSGGTLANLTALLSARKAIIEIDIWNEGQDNRLGIMVYEEAHYCIERAAKIMGLGEKGIIKIPATKDFSMDTSQLEGRYQKAKENGVRIFAVVGSAPSTATGSYDDLEEIAKFAKRHKLWFHVDGAHGGAAIFSRKYRHTVQGIGEADSVAIDGHKMMLMPMLTTALLFKNGHHSYATFSQRADYLLDQSEDEDWYNLAKRTFECTKTMMSLHWFTMLKTYGEGVIEEYVTNQFNLGRQFAKMVENDSRFELAVKPQSNIVCFRFIGRKLDVEGLNQLNAGIRQKLLEDGEFYIVQTQLMGIQYLRTTIMNPFTTVDHLESLLGKIKKLGDT